METLRMKAETKLFGEQFSSCYIAEDFIILAIINCGNQKILELQLKTLFLKVPKSHFGKNKIN